MKKLLIYLILSCSVLTAQQKEETVEVPKSMLSDTQKQKLETANIKEKAELYGNWVGLGKEIGSAVDGSLSALTTNADNFAKTGVGKFTMFLVAYKVIGTDLIQFVIGVPLMVIGFFVWVYSYWSMCTTRSVLIKVLPDKTKEYRTINNTTDNYSADVHRTRILHFLILMVFLAFCTAVIFI